MDFSYDWDRGTTDQTTTSGLNGFTKLYEKGLAYMKLSASKLGWGIGNCHLPMKSNHNPELLSVETIQVVRKTNAPMDAQKIAACKLLNDPDGLGGQVCQDMQHNWIDKSAVPM